MLGTFKSIAEIRAANMVYGYHWFDRSAMRSFGTRIESGVYSGKYFITSEKNYNGTKRLYSIRQAESNGDVRTVGEFNSIPTLDEARAQVRAIVREEEQALLARNRE